MRAAVMVRQPNRAVLAYLGLLLLNLILISPVLVYDLTLFDGLGQPKDIVGIFTFAISVLWISLIHILFRRCLLLHVILLPFYLVVACELFLLSTFDSRLTTSYIGILLGEFHHADDFLGTWGREVALAVVCFALLYPALLWSIRHLSLTFDKRLALLPLIGLLLLYGGATYRQVKVLETNVSRALFDVLQHDKNSPFGVLAQSYVITQLRERNAERRIKRRNFSFGARKENKSTTGEVHVLVIGESARPDRWSLGGYHRRTNPLLEKTDRLVFFPEAIAEIALTSRSVPLILTRESAAEAIPGATKHSFEKSIVTAFNESRFKTHWLSNVQWDSFSGDIPDFALEAVIRRYFERRHDGVLLQAMDWALSKRKAEENSFFVFHTQGSHFDYRKRYPKAFEVFPVHDGLSRKEATNNAYDNSIVYTDHFLAQIISRLDRIGGVSTLLYVSDHGENLMDDEREILGHFRNNEYDLPTAMLFWWSKGFAEQSPGKVASVKANGSTRITTASVFASLADAGGVIVPGTDMQLSVLSDSLRQRPRIVLRKDGPTDYDKWLSSQALDVSKSD